MKNNIVKPNKPFIFSKKLNDNNKIIPLKKVKNTLGPMRYFPPANQEWNNSIYVYNNMTIKNISIAQKNLTRLIKSYFNIYFSKNLLSSKRILTRFRRLAINKIFVSKAELKHTNNKIIITLYIYNEERRILIHRLKRIEAILFPYYAITSKEVYKDFTSFLSLKERLNLIKKEDAFSFLGLLEEIKKYITEEIKLEKKNLEAINKLNFREEKLLKVEALEESLKKILAIISSCESDPLYFKQYENIYRKFISKTLLEKEITTIAYYKLLLNINKYKFEDLFLSRLSPLISKIYNKEVEFNIVNLKAVYLNSDIFTQAIALKLRNRNNRLLRVLRSFLYMVKLPKVNILKERFAHINIKNLWVNRVKNLTTNSLAINLKRDSINNLLTGLFITSNFSKKLEVSESSKYNNYKGDKSNLDNNLLNHVLLNLKHKSMAGVRLEAKGRLTRRFTASRSVFKIKWKGSLKNIDSSYRGLSSVILKGHTKSNVQYSIVNSKTRNGAFGLKGWISGK
jgi:Mitochondrial ribosomal protein (VAR1)